MVKKIILFGLIISFAAADSQNLLKLQQELDQIAKITAQSGLTKQNTQMLKKKIQSLNDETDYIKAKASYNLQSYKYSKKYAISLINSTYNFLTYLERNIKRNLTVSVSNYVKIGEQVQANVSADTIQNAVNFLIKEKKMYDSLIRAKVFLYTLKNEIIKHRTHIQIIDNLISELSAFSTNLDFFSNNQNQTGYNEPPAYIPQGQEVGMNNTPNTYPMQQPGMQAQPQNGSFIQVPNSQAAGNTPAGIPSYPTSVQNTQNKTQIITLKCGEMIQPEYNIKIKKITADYLYIGF